MGSGSSGDARGPVRTCIGCRSREPVSRLIRLVADPTGGCVVDYDRSLPGRGAHIHPRAECIDQAVARRALARALRVGPGAGIDMTQVRAQLLE